MSAVHTAYDHATNATALDALAYICDHHTTLELRALVADLDVLLINTHVVSPDYIPLWDGFDLARAKLQARHGKPREYRGFTWTIAHRPYFYAANPGIAQRMVLGAISSRPTTTRSAQ